MKLLSINVGLPREVRYRGKTVMTSIFKAPVSGRVRMGRLNVEAVNKALASMLAFARETQGLTRRSKRSPRRRTV